MEYSDHCDRTTITAPHDQECNVPNEHSWERQQSRPNRPIVAVFTVGGHEECPNYERSSDDGRRDKSSPRSRRRGYRNCVDVRHGSNDEVERPRDHLWRAADIVDAEKLDIVRLALYASRTARTDC